jgi:anti-sigma B factor antagonist
MEIFMSLNVTVHETNVATVVALSGRLTIGESATQLRDALQKLIADGKKKLVVNLAGLTSLDSAGIGLLVSSYASMNRAGGQMKLSNLNSKVKDVLLITKLLTVFPVYDDELAALDSFAESAAKA